MNPFAPALIWCALQVTVLAAIVGVWYLILARCGPAARAWALLTGLGLIVALTALSFCPWPRWSSDRLLAALKTDSQDTVIGETAEGTTSAADASDPPLFPRAGSEFQASSGRSIASLFFEALRQSPPPDLNSPRAGGLPWLALGAGFVAAGCLLGLARLLGGWAVVRKYRAESRQINEPSLLELRDVIQAELGCRRAIALRESRLLSTAATIGWRQPAVLLPEDWRAWSEPERRAVLAHEIAHIERRDFPTWVAAQVALVLHFYHPFVHWLCGRLRLEQELAADAAASRLAGGQRAYLTILAALALRNADRPVAWPARTFLPTRGTFLRRIEMLRDTNLTTARFSRGLRIGTVVILAAAGLGIAGFRGAQAPAGAAGAPPAVAASAATVHAADHPVGLEYVPRDAAAVAMVRPAALLKQPRLAQLARALGQPDSPLLFGAALNRVESVTWILLMGSGPPTGLTEPALAGLIVRTLDAADANAIVGATLPNAAPQEYGGRRYLKSAQGRPTLAFPIDERTLVIAHDEAHLRRVIIAGPTGASKAKWSAAWSEIGGEFGAVLVNLDAVGPALDEELRRGADQPGPGKLLAPFAPLWRNVNTAIAGFTLDENLTLSGVLISPAAEDAKKAKETLAAAVTLGKNSLSQVRGAVARDGGNEGAVMLGAVDILDTLLEGATIAQNDRKVEFSAKVDGPEAATLFGLLAPAVTQTRSAARRAQSINNLKQIGLAMHNYHDTYKRFPAAVMYGPDGKTPYSWRVALLPFVEGARQFNEYKFTEPWDSESNRKVLANMPAVFRDPQDPVNSTNAAYFALTGPETIFAGAEGAQMHQIVDGTSNTLMLVEAQREVPWTKPEDLPYDAAKPLPPLGGRFPGLFLALFCDGSVRMISQAADQSVLRAAITKAGGEPVDAPRLLNSEK